jgi:hypothetical protein
MTEQPSITFRVEDREFDISDLTWDEVEQIEEQFDTAFAELDFGRAKIMRVIVLTLMRHENPKARMEDLGQIKILKSMLQARNGAGPE